MMGSEQFLVNGEQFSVNSEQFSTYPTVSEVQLIRTLINTVFLLLSVFISVNPCPILKGSGSKNSYQLQDF